MKVSLKVKKGESESTDSPNSTFPLRFASWEYQLEKYVQRWLIYTIYMIYTIYTIYYIVILLNM